MVVIGKLGRRGRYKVIESIRNPKCTECDLHKTEGNVCVMGRGNLMAPIVLVGEAPGAAEAETGKPFMGRAGHLLNKILKELRMSEMVYITNAVRCRPPKNRTPDIWELKCCRNLYLFPEVGIIRPHVIVLMGKTAARAFNVEDSFHPLIQYHYPDQAVFAYRRVCVIITWHPAYCLRNGKMTTAKFKKHLAKAREEALERSKA